VIREKYAEALGNDAYSEKTFKSEVACILIPANGVISFVLKNGSIRSVSWENPPRFWTDEMKVALSVKQKERYAKKRGVTG